ncbi:MAG: glutamate--tRNA ligase family protein [Verrucomicrobiota bacterium]
MTTPVRVRFAPSPTGYLHVGGARTALFNWLFARHNSGTFILRIEDTDRARYTPEALQAIYDGLHWLGFLWDEGPDVGGDYGPYFQSERDAIYERYLKKLEEAGMIYEDAGAIRFRFVREKIVVDDVICGRIEFDMTDPSTNPDMTIRRPDGSWIFHFVSVVDDIEMKITHVIRGEDHLSNTPKHVQLYQAFGVQPPVFGHIPLILNKDGSKMSKRDQGASVGSYIEDGYLPEAVCNFLCLLGWSPKDNREKIAIEEVARIFDLKNINRKAATFDLEKCAWFSGEYMRELPPQEFIGMAEAFLAKQGMTTGFPQDYVRAALATCIGKVRILAELPAYAGFYFKDDFEYNPEGVVKNFTLENKPRLQAVRDAFAAAQPFDAATLETALKTTAATLGVKAGVLVHPARLSVTGSNAGPSLYHLLEILGREKTLARIDRGLEAFPAT